MIIDDVFESVLDQVSGRFAEREKHREMVETALAHGDILGVNSRDLVANRMRRLGVDLDEAYALQAGELRLGSEGRGSHPQTDFNVLERILDANNLTSVAYAYRAADASKAIARIHIKSAGGVSRGFGTGFMVSRSLLLTNNHVLRSASAAQFSQAEFNFEADQHGRMRQSVFVALDPGTFFLTDRHLDYSLVAVDASADLSSFGWLPLIEEQGKLLVGERVNIIQHPSGEPKQLALRENLVVDELEDFLHYKTDTSPGSSGSPVLNDAWEVVSLHHAGVPDRDADGNILAVDGRPWRRSMGAHRVRWVANEGARISRVVRHAKAQRLGPGMVTLLEGIDEPRPSPDSLERNANSEVNNQAGSAVSNDEVEHRGPVIGSDGKATWEVPLRISVDLGPRSTAPTSSTPKPVLAMGRALLSRDEPPELVALLAQLEDVRERPYYDEVADIAARDVYYRDVSLTSSKASNFNKLRALLRETHHTKPRYKPRRWVYPWVDLRPDLTLKSIYSGKGFSAEALIREDFAIEQGRMARVRELMANSDLSQESLEIELDLLESHNPFNCEHVVPQSWFRKKEPMKGDLHHLFTCEWGCNSFRGNLPYFDFEDFEEAIRNECGKQEDGNRFEPSHGKGPVARATCYFLLRYPEMIGDEARELQERSIELLRDWHESDPVSEYELHRNAAIFEIQGNRNPFIDHPEWLGKVDIRKGFG